MLQSKGRNSSITVVCELQELPPYVHVQKNCPSGLLFITMLRVHYEESCLPPPQQQQKKEHKGSWNVIISWTDLNKNTLS